MHVDLALAAITLFLAAVVFLFAELFVPAHGLLALVCLACAVGGVVVCFEMSDAVGVLSLFGTLLALPLVAWAIVKYYPESPVGRRIMLARPKPALPVGTLGSDKTSDQLLPLIGRCGVTVTTLRPAGICEIDGKRIDSLSEATVVERGTAVQVVRVTGSQVVVRVIDNVAAAAPAPNSLSAGYAPTQGDAGNAVGSNDNNAVDGGAAS
ncbi:MAG: hypothetical protein HKL96_03170 [Phycisphaerales bacterium]|nr:hypothetical protein [Phycisphaerales bacterium]